MIRYYSCCGDPADGSSGSGCDHRRGRVLDAAEWRRRSHGSEGPWDLEWRDRGTMCASGCGCRDEADDQEAAS